MAVDLIGALLGWLTAEAGSKTVRGTRRLLLGDPQRQALHLVAVDAVDCTVAEVGLTDEKAKHLRAALLERDGTQDLLSVRNAAGLRVALGAWTAALDAPEPDGPGYLRTLGVDADRLAEELATRIEAGIRAEAQDGGALQSVAEFLWRDDTTASLGRIETKIDALEPLQRQSAESLVRKLFVQDQQLPRRSPPSFLLRSGYKVVRFRGRERELADYVAWCKEDNDVGVRLCFAAGGQGKTRFAQELVRQFTECGWLAGRLRTHCDSESLAELFRLPAHVLVVVDYAETQPRCLERILKLLEEPRPDGTRLRLLLLARSPGQWWDALRAGASDPFAALLYDAAHELPPLFERADNRESEFMTAVADFAEAGKYRSEGLVPPADIDDDRYALALTLHMSALAALLDHQSGWRDGEKPTHWDPATRVLDHERHYWADTAKAEELPYARRRVLDAVMTTVTCCGAASRDEAVALLSELPDLAGEHPRVLGQYADWAHQLHPGNNWLNPLEPDLLGEYFVAQVLRDQENLVDALARAPLSNEQQFQLMTILTRAAERHNDIPAVINRVLRTGVNELWAKAAVLAAYLPDPRVLVLPLLDTLATVDRAEILGAAALGMPSSHRVSELKIAVASEALSRYRALPDRSLTTEIDLLDALASGLFYADRHDEQAETQLEVLKLYAQLVKQEPKRYTHDLARTMLNYGNQLVNGGQANHGLDLAKKVVTLAQVIRAEERPELLSKAFDLRARALKDLGRLEDAARAAERAVQEGCIAAKSSDFAAAWLPMLIMNLANRYSELGRYQQALQTIREAMAELREREAERPDPLSPNVFKVLINYAECLQDCGISSQAREVIAEAVARLQHLTARYPKFRADLGLAVTLWASYLSPLPADDEQMHTEYEHVIGLLADIGATEKSLRTVHARVMIEFGTKLLHVGDRERGRQWRTKGKQLHCELLTEREV